MIIASLHPFKKFLSKFPMSQLPLTILGRKMSFRIDKDVYGKIPDNNDYMLGFHVKFRVNLPGLSMFFYRPI